MVRTLLVYPSRTRHPLPPLGIAYLAAVLRKNDYDVKIIDVNSLESDEEFRDKIRDYNPGIIGFTAQTMNIEDAFYYTNIAKEVLPNIPIIYGGPHPSVMPEEILKNDNIDMCMVGESEISFLKLIKTLEGSEQLKDVPNLYYKDRGVIKKTERCNFVEDLDSLPWPARDMLPMEDYLRKIPAPPMIMPYTHVIINRGCPFNCKFCQPTSHTMWGRKVRYRNPKNVCDEIEHLIEEYKIKMIDIEADTFTVDKKWVKMFCEEYKNRKIQIPWIAAAKVGSVDYITLKAMKDAGCVAVSVGVESGSQEMLDKLGKGVKVGEIIQYFRWCNKLGLITNTSFMVGSPGETKQTLDATMRLIKEIKPDYFVSYITTPLPGTELYDVALNEGIIDFKNYSELDKHHTTLNLDGLTNQDIVDYRNKMYSEYAKLRLSYLFDKNKVYLHKQMLKRIISLRHAKLGSVKSSYTMLHTQTKNPIRKVYEMVIKSL